MQSIHKFISEKGNTVVFTGRWEYGISGKKEPDRRAWYKRSKLDITVDGTLT